MDSADFYGAAPAAPAFVPGRSGLLPGATPAEATLPKSVRRSRWRKTPTTFGPVGRLACTLALLLPLPFMVVGGLADPFVWGGAGFWGLVVMPLALRDIWKQGIVTA